MKDKKRSKKDIQRENDELKLRLSQEFGGLFGNDSDLTPEIENRFLKNVEAFEKQFAEGKEITVYKKIGCPEWVSVDEIDDSKITEVLNDLQNLLHQNGISVDTICKVENRELYRFITEELLEEKIMDLTIEGMITCFIYEEFHPNHKYDVEQTTRDFITQLLQFTENTDDWFFNEDLKVKLSPDINVEESIRKIKNFINAYSAFELYDLEITSLELAEDLQQAHVTFDIHYDASIEGSTDTLSFDGAGKMKLDNVFERLGVAGWDIRAFDIPGFKI